MDASETETLTVTVVHINEEGAILNADSTMTQMFGYSSESVVGKTLDMFFSSQDRGK
jgi:PAS domain S-box-containing protein